MVPHNPRKKGQYKQTRSNKLKCSQTTIYNIQVWMTTLPTRVVKTEVLPNCGEQKLEWICFLISLISLPVEVVSVNREYMHIVYWSCALVRVVELTLFIFTPSATSYRNYRKDMDESAWRGGHIKKACSNPALLGKLAWTEDSKVTKYLTKAT